MVDLQGELGTEIDEDTVFVAAEKTWHEFFENTVVEAGRKLDMKNSYTSEIKKFNSIGLAEDDGSAVLKIKMLHFQSTNIFIHNITKLINWINCKLFIDGFEAQMGSESGDQTAAI